MTLAFTSSSLMVLSGAPLEALWASLTSRWGDATLFIVGSLVIHEGVYILAGLFWFTFDLLAPHVAFIQQHKIQKGKTVSWSDIKKLLWQLLFLHVLLTPPLIYASYPLIKAVGISTSLPLPSWPTMLLHLLIFAIVEDVCFYCGHRFLHTDWGYRNIHRIHHEFSAPIAIVYEYAHPAEYLFLGFGSVAGPALVGPHLLTVWVWLVLRQLQSLDDHSGYDFWWQPSHWFPFYAGSVHHDYHHRFYSGNYASWFTYLDRILGTDKQYLRWRDKARNKGA